MIGLTLAVVFGGTTAVILADIDAAEALIGMNAMATTAPRSAATSRERCTKILENIYMYKKINNNNSGNRSTLLHCITTI
jgi:hypothetical protein